MSASQFTIYRSTDASAPVLNGSAGSLNTVLLACLVNGYGSKAAAGGGWTNPFHGTTDQEVYRQAGGNQNYLQVDDHGTVPTGTTREARVWGFEAMSAYNTGSGTVAFPFPADARAGSPGTQRANGLCWHKSDAATSTAVQWMVVADATTVYIFSKPTGTTIWWLLGMFGDIYSFVSGDAYRCAIGGNTTEVAGAESSEGIVAYTTSTLTGTTAFKFLARNNAGSTNGSCTAGLIGHSISVQTGPGLETNGAYPNPVSGSFDIAPLYVMEGTTLTGGSTATAQIVRGRWRGLWTHMHNNNNFQDGDIVQGQGVYSGRTFMIVKTLNVSNGNSGSMLIETSNTVETN